MRLRPFLSHKRVDHDAVAQLKLELALRGTGGWQDTDDLLLGDHTPAGVREAIRSETGGFIWFGTPEILESKFVNEIEIPAALERKHADSSYPLVPMFAELKPNDDLRQRLAAVIGPAVADALLACNGPARDPDEELLVFLARAASRYVRDAVRRLGGSAATVAITALREPGASHDLTFDWRSLLDPRRRVLVPGATEMMIGVLAEAGEALQACSSVPQIELTLDVPLPVAFLIGHEWRITSRMKLAVRQRTGAEYITVAGDGPVAPPPDRLVESRGGAGPAVIAVSVNTDLGAAADRYAERVDAGRLIRIHVPGLLEPAGLRGLARITAHVLKDLNNAGTEKHLLMLGPGALPLLAGAAANATGPTTLPLWNGSNFEDAIVVGRP